MTRQNKIHIHVRRCQQDRKKTIREWDTHIGERHKHNRKWWKAWHKTNANKWSISAEGADE